MPRGTTSPGPFRPLLQARSGRNADSSRGGRNGPPVLRSRGPDASKAHRIPGDDSTSRGGKFPCSLDQRRRLSIPRVAVFVQRMGRHAGNFAFGSAAVLAQTSENRQISGLPPCVSRHNCTHSSHVCARAQPDLQPVHALPEQATMATKDNASIHLRERTFRKIMKPSFLLQIGVWPTAVIPVRLPPGSCRAR